MAIKLPKYSLRTLLFIVIGVNLLMCLCVALDLFHKPVESVPVYGQTVEEVVALFGEPTLKTERTMDMPLGGLSRPLLDIYPPDANITVKHFRWDRWYYKIHIWFGLRDGKWIVVSTCRHKWWVRF